MNSEELNLIIQIQPNIIYCLIELNNIYFVVVGQIDRQMPILNLCHESPHIAKQIDLLTKDNETFGRIAEAIKNFPYFEGKNPELTNDF